MDLSCSVAPRLDPASPSGLVCVDGRVIEKWDESRRTAPAA